MINIGEKNHQHLRNMWYSCCYQVLVISYNIPIIYIYTYAHRNNIIPIKYNRVRLPICLRFLTIRFLASTVLCMLQLHNIIRYRIRRDSSRVPNASSAQRVSLTVSFCGDYNICIRINLCCRCSIDEITTYGSHIKYCRMSLFKFHRLRSRCLFNILL